MRDPSLTIDHTHHQPRLVDVVPAAFRALGIAEAGGGKRLTFPSATKVCLVLVDGLGAHQLRARSGHAPFLGSMLNDAVIAQTTFPSTTAVALTSFSTGHGPGSSGIVGYSVLDPATDRVMSYLKWDSPVAPEAWQPHPSYFVSAREKGVHTAFIGPRRFDESGLTRAAFTGMRMAFAESLSDRVETAVAALQDMDCVYLYWGDVDLAGHRHGWQSWQWCNELESLDWELAQLARELPAGTLLIVTADHGMVDSPASAHVDIAGTPQLTRGIRAVGGEPRAVHLYADSDPEDLAERWDDHFGDEVVIATKKEAIGAGVFGHVDERVVPLLGDVIVAARTEISIHDSRSATPQSLRLIGMHGSVTDDECEVPVLVHLAS